MNCASKCSGAQARQLVRHSSALVRRRRGPPGLPRVRRAHRHQAVAVLARPALQCHSQRLPVIHSGLPYDSDGGRAWAGAITALMTGHAMPRALDRGSDGSLRRLRRQRRGDAERAADAPGRDGEDRRGARPARAAERGAALVGRSGRGRRGLRRAQRPGQRARADRHHRSDDGLRHHRHRARPRPGQDKKLVGGGTMQIVNQTIPRALRKLGYSRPPRSTRSSPHRRAQDDPRRAASSKSTCPCSRARWATTRSTTWVTSR